jgi:hypothetical protein
MHSVANKHVTGAESRLLLDMTQLLFGPLLTLSSQAESRNQVVLCMAKLAGLTRPRLESWHNTGGGG